MKPVKNITAKVNDQFSFDADQLSDIDMVPIDDRHFHLLSGGKSYRAELVSADHKRKTFTIKINGSKYHVQLADSYDQMVERLGLGVVTAKAAKDVMAPMPGLVLQIMIKSGEEVNEGQPLLILEAMKMENVIKATADGVVAQVEVNKGDAVDKGQMMIKMEG
jgi:biotin carboxyl carrier protein